MRNRLTTVIALGLWVPFIVAAADAPPIPTAPADVKYTIRICEGGESLQFWFNDEAKERWSACKTPIPDVPVFLVTDSGKRGEGKTGKDGIAALPAVAVAANEKFRLAMACTTHHCFSLHGLFVGAPDVKAGPNLLYAETTRK
jgi:hypothetical protein